MKKYSSLFYSVAGVAILFVVVIAFNAVTAAFKQRIDLTKEKAYTLSAGTRAILKKLDTPVKIRFYLSTSGEGSPESVYLKTYAQHVSDLLDEYKQLGHGKIVLEQFDPKPDSDAEDSAKLDGVEGEPLRNGDKFYLGLSVSQLDTKEAIPFLDPNRERLLEYDLSRAITRVANPEKPVVGIMSSLLVFGRESNPMLQQMGQKGQAPWQMVDLLKNDYTVREVELTATNIPADVKVLIVIHPKQISDATQFAIDQFVLRGGKLIAFLDSTCLTDSRSENPMFGSMPGGGSTLDKLLKAWGIQFDDTKTLADMTYKVQVGGQGAQTREIPTFLDLVDSAINKDDVATSEIKDIWYPFGGVFTGTPAAGLTETVLLKSSKETQLVDGTMAAMSSENVMKEFKSSDTEYNLAIRLAGKFKTAFPDGLPKESSDAKDATNAPPKPAGDFLKESKTDGMVVLFGDADMLADEYSLRQRQTIFGPAGYEPANGNLILLQNLVDQMGGDNDLITIRSRAALDRPFTRIRAMEAKAEEAYQAKVADFEKSIEETQQKVNELQAKKGNGTQRFILSPEQVLELEKLKKSQASMNLSLKKVRKELNREITTTETTIKWTNIVVMPALVAFSGIGLAIWKRKRTAAK